MRILKLTDSNVKRAAAHPELVGLKRLARGAFCSVYDKGDTVLKLTCDGKQYGMYADYCAPKGDYFPRLIADHGNVGTTRDGLDMYLVEMEKLTSMSKGSLAVRRLAKNLLSAVNEAFGEVWNSNCRKMIRKKASTYSSIYAMDKVAQDPTFPLDLRESLDDLSIFFSNYECGMDFHMGNLMLRGEQLVLNDVVADVGSVFKAQKFA